MRILLISGWLFLGSVLAANPERRVVEIIEQSVKEGGAVNFSALYNDSRLSAEERNFLGRLYEIFFQLPDYVRSEHQATGRIPSTAQIAAGFGISSDAVQLLLQVMKADPRVPPMFQLDPRTGEIASLDLNNIDRFLSRRGAQVKVTQWEGKPLPSFRLTTFDGGSLSNADLQGQPALLYFWFSGCPPCVRQAPHLAALTRKYPQLKVVGLNADRVLELEVTDEDRNKYLRDHGLDFLNVHLDQATRQAFGNLNVFPTFFLVKPDGTILRYLINYQEPGKLDELAGELIGG